MPFAFDAFHSGRTTAKILRALEFNVPGPGELPPIPEPSAPDRREYLTEVFARDSTHVACIRDLYRGKCQVTGKLVLDGLSIDLTQVHQLDFLCQGGVEHPSNMIALSPN